MNEYGSEFYFEKINSKKNNEFWNFGIDRKFLFSGRTALDYVLKNIKNKSKKLTIYLPNYICESVINVIKENNLTIKFYTVEIENNEFKYKINLEEKIDIFFGMNYFGIKSNEIDTYIQYFSSKNIIVIEDITHRLLCENNFCKNSDYLICSLRKWFPIVSGGIAIANKKKFNKKIKLHNAPFQYVLLKKMAMKLKRIYILKNKNEYIKKIYMKLFRICQNHLNKKYELKKIDCYSLKYINVVNIDEIRKKRIANGIYIQENLKNRYIKLIGKIQDGYCPLFVPCIVKNKELISKELIKNKFYFPSHWPICNENKKYTNDLFNNEISIVCDQRYFLNETKEIINFLNNMEVKNENNDKCKQKNE